MNWSEIPLQFNYVAMNRDGSWSAFSEVPTLNVEMGIWECGEDCIIYNLDVSYDCLDWRLSCEVRVGAPRYFLVKVIYDDVLIPVLVSSDGICNGTIEEIAIKNLTGTYPMVRKVRDSEGNRLIQYIIEDRIFTTTSIIQLSTRKFNELILLFYGE